MYINIKMIEFLQACKKVLNQKKDKLFNFVVSNFYIKNLAALLTNCKKLSNSYATVAIKLYYFCLKNNYIYLGYIMHT